MQRGLGFCLPRWSTTERQQHHELYWSCILHFEGLCAWPRHDVHTQTACWPHCNLLWGKHREKSSWFKRHTWRKEQLISAVSGTAKHCWRTWHWYGRMYTVIHNYRTPSFQRHNLVNIQFISTKISISEREIMLREAFWKFWQHLAQHYLPLWPGKFCVCKPHID